MGFGILMILTSIIKYPVELSSLSKLYSNLLMKENPLCHTRRGLRLLISICRGFFQLILVKASLMDTGDFLLILCEVYER